MSVQTTSNLTNSIRTQYTDQYLMSAYQQRLYDQFCIPVPGISMDQAIRGSAVQYEFISEMTPGTTALSQTADVTPQILRDAVATVTPTSRGEALQWSEQLDIQVFTDYAQARIKRIAENMQESVEFLAIDTLLAGTFVQRAIARASLDAGTAGHRCSDNEFAKAHGMMLTLKVPGFVNANGEANTWGAAMHPYVYHDVMESGNVDSIGLYQDMGIHLNYELAKIGPFRMVVSPYAKVFGGAGIDNGTAVATTLASAANALATTFVTAADVSANVAVGLHWTVGTEETSTTFYHTNEMIKPLSASTTTITFVGPSENGGFRYDHASGTAVRNADSVYTVLFGGPASAVKLYDPGTGEFGEFVQPHTTGNLNQFITAGWKFYGGYGLISQNRVLRGEYSTSYEA